MSKKGFFLKNQNEKLDVMHGSYNQFLLVEATCIL